MSAGAPTFERMEGVVQPYAWGSRSFIPALLGTEASDEPQAELWLGAHPKAPSTVGGRPLPDLIAEDPTGVLGAASVDAFGPRLPYLLKVLAADRPLSLQAHPSREQAEAGFAREEAEGVPIDAPHRLFKDDWPKPELLCALTETDALCGFRAPQATYALVEQLGARRALELMTPLGYASQPEPRRLERVFSAIMRLSPDQARHAVSEVVAHADGVSSEGELGVLARTVGDLAGYFPDNPGVLAALLMNRVSLAPGDAIFLPAGNLHAYLHGVGIEVMANSDNVLRGGLTPKHVDLDELLRVLDFTPSSGGVRRGDVIEPGVWRYPTPAPEFALWKLEPTGDTVTVPASDRGRSLIVVDGDVELRGDGHDLALRRGQAAFLAAGTTAALSGAGTAFLAGPGV